MKAILAALLLCLALPASAMTASPMGQTLDANTTTGALRIRNDSKGEKRYQVMVDMITLGADGKKVFTPSTDFTFFPSSVLTLAPGKIQTLRWKRNANQPGREAVYRVELRETPLDNADAMPIGQGASVNIRPRMLLPWLFVPHGAKPDLRAHREADFLVLENAGTGTARLHKIAYAGNKDPGPQLVLPGERLRLKVESSAPTVSFILVGTLQTLAVE